MYIYFCQFFAGYLHLFATDENIQFNPFHEDTDLADPVS
jgi:hypothetical protein